MAKNRSDKSPFPSRFSPGSWVSFHQFLAELACERAARKEYKELPLKFWAIKKWKNFLVWQAKLAIGLKAKYREDAILGAFNDKRCKTVFSLNAEWFIKVVEEYELKPEQKTEKEPEMIVQEEIKSIRPSTGGNTLASLLD